MWIQIIVWWKCLLAWKTLQCFFKVSLLPKNSHRFVHLGMSLFHCHIACCYFCHGALSSLLIVIHSYWYCCWQHSYQWNFLCSFPNKDRLLLLNYEAFWHACLLEQNACITEQKLREVANLQIGTGEYGHSCHSQALLKKTAPPGIWRNIFSNIIYNHDFSSDLKPIPAATAFSSLFSYVHINIWNDYFK